MLKRDRLAFREEWKETIDQLYELFKGVHENWIPANNKVYPNASLIILTSSSEKGAHARLILE
jgi:hypothetical protein